MLRTTSSLRIPLFTLCSLFLSLLNGACISRAERLAAVREQGPIGVVSGHIRSDTLTLETNCGEYCAQRLAAVGARLQINIMETSQLCPRSDRCPVSFEPQTLIGTHLVRLTTFIDEEVALERVQRLTIAQNTIEAVVGWSGRKLDLEVNFTIDYGHFQQQPVSKISDLNDIILIRAEVRNHATSTLIMNKFSDRILALTADSQTFSYTMSDPHIGQFGQSIPYLDAVLGKSTGAFWFYARDWKNFNRIVFYVDSRNREIALQPLYAQQPAGFRISVAE